VEVPEVPHLLRGRVRFGSSEVLLHWRRPACGSDRAYFSQVTIKFGSIDNHSPMRGHMGHPEASQGDLENQPVL
jgi:hypothetical protein